MFYSEKYCYQRKGFYWFNWFWVLASPEISKLGKTASLFFLRFSLNTLQTNSVVQQSCHFSRKLVYGLIVTTYHTAVTVISNALFTTGKKKKKCVKKASISVEYLQLCKTLCLEYRCLYISSAVLGVACSHDCICRQPKWISTISAPV